MISFKIASSSFKKCSQPRFLSHCVPNNIPFECFQMRRYLPQFNFKLQMVSFESRQSVFDVSLLLVEVVSSFVIESSRQSVKNLVDELKFLLICMERWFFFWTGWFTRVIWSARMRGLNWHSYSEPLFHWWGTFASLPQFWGCFAFTFAAFDFS